MKAIRIIGRNSRLSLVQMELVRDRIRELFPDLPVTLLPRSSRGDQLPDVPLQTVEGSDFFTQDIFDALAKNEADIAVHSLKDMSAAHFFGANRFAVVDRDEVRDVVFFNPDIEEKLQQGKEIRIGTCSPRREEMALEFLQKALPQTGAFRITTKIIRGNIDSRLRKLHEGEYDGIILAAAGINRLLRSKADQANLCALLKNKKRMLLPLIECVPAPCQGAIVAEAHPDNKNAVRILQSINQMDHMEDCVQEKQIALHYGTGCLQRFGVATIRYQEKKIRYAAGTDQQGQPFTSWKVLPPALPERKKLFSTTDHMGRFFGYQYLPEINCFPEPVAFVANYKAVTEPALPWLRQKDIWASGTKTWLELAKKGYWVTGSADAMGLETLEPVWNSPLFTVSRTGIRLITHEDAATHWRSKGWKARAVYRLTDTVNPFLLLQLEQADAVFWTSFRQFEQYRTVLKKNLIHYCPAGETVTLLREAGIEPVVFPHIKAFQQWRPAGIPQPYAV